MTEIGQKETSGNCFKKDYVKLEIAYADPSFYENCFPYFWVRDKQYPKHFRLQNFQRIHIIGFQLNPSYAHPLPPGATRLKASRLNI